MSDELRLQIHSLCVSYYQMKISENEVNRFDDGYRGLSSREFLVKCFETNEKLYNDQLQVVDDLIQKEAENYV